MTADVRMAEVAALVGDPARANILAALMGGSALTARHSAPAPKGREPLVPVTCSSSGPAMIPAANTVA